MATSDQILAGNEFLDLELAIAHQPQRDRLHPASRARARQLAPEHRRQGEPDEIIERAARQIGIDQGTSILRGFAIASVTDCLVMALKTTRSTSWSLRAFFSFSTSRTCQEIASPSRSGSVARMSLVGALQGLGDVVQPLLGLGIDFPEHVEIVVGVDRAILRRQVADMAKGGQDLVASAQDTY